MQCNECNAMNAMKWMQSMQSMQCNECNTMNTMKLMYWNSAINECNAMNAINKNKQSVNSIQPARLIIKPSFHLPHECSAMQWIQCNVMDTMQ